MSERVHLWTPVQPSSADVMTNRSKQLEKLFECVEADSVENLRPLLTDSIEYELRSYDLLTHSSTQLICANPPPSIRGPTLVHLAVWFSSHAILRFFIENEPKRKLDATTMEGLTPLHLAAAVGDFVAVDMLLAHCPSVIQLDDYGSTPLHYAINTDLRVTVLLCGHSLTYFNMTDKLGRTPIDLAVEFNDQDCARFLSMFSQSDQTRLTRDEGVRDNAFNILSKQNRRATWIPLHLKAPLCIKPTEKPITQRGYCTCSAALADHTFQTRNPILAERFASGSVQFVDAPTETFGEVEFPHNTFVSDYVRVGEQVEMNDIIQMFGKVWSLSRPNLILSFYGSSVSSSIVKESLKKLIWKSSDSTLTWIITDGCESSISPMVTQATKEYIDAYGPELVQSIGIVPWQSVGSMPELSSPTMLGRHPAVPPVNRDEPESQGALDSRLTNYIFVDTEDKSCDRLTMEFRRKLEKYLQTWSGDESNGEFLVTNRTDIQICGILSGGEESILMSVHGAITEGTPFIVLRNTGGLADILGECIQDTEVGEKIQRKRAVSEGSREMRGFRLSPANIRQIASAHWDFIEKPEIVVVMIQEILENSHMLSICDVEEDELDYYMVLLLLIGSSRCGEEAEELNYSKLDIAIALNRSDVAQELFQDNLKWDNVRLGAYMTSLLLQGNVPFVKLFVEKGFNLTQYLDQETLEMLYTKSVHSSKASRKSLRGVIRRLAKLPKTISLVLVGKVLSLFMGSHYRSNYLKSRRSHKKHSVQNTEIQNPATDLFIWALLTERRDIADYMWSQTQEPLGAALVAAALLRSFGNHVQSLVDRDEMFEYANSFEEKATGLLNECFFEDPATTAEALVRERTLFGRKSCLVLAADGRSMSFISHRCSEECIKQVWYGALDPQSGTPARIAALLIGIFLPFLIPFSLKFNLAPEQKSDSEKSDGSRSAKQSVDQARDSDAVERNLFARVNWKASRKEYWRKIYAFYRAPFVRFAYTTMSLITFICFFTFVLLFSVERQKSGYCWTNLILLFWVFTYLVENIRQGVIYGLSFRAHMKKFWKALELCAIFFYVLGASMDLIRIAEFQEASMSVNLKDIVETTLIRMGDIFYGISLFLFFYRLLEAFTVDFRIGSMVIMIQTMVINDLMPFLALFVVSLFSFSILQWTVLYKSTASESHVKNLETMYLALKRAYFQIFGEYELSGFSEPPGQCLDGENNCVDGAAQWISPVLLAMFVILTQVLLLNLLIAQFATTYGRIETASVGYWSLQRYQVICEFAERSPIPPPLIVCWHIYLLIKYILRNSRRSNGDELHFHPFRKSYASQISRERQLSNWEKLRFWDYQRYVLQGRERKNKKTKSVNVRTTVVARSAGPMGNEVTKSLRTLENATSEHLREIIDKANRIEAVEKKVDEILKTLNKLHISFQQTDERTERQSLGRRISRLSDRVTNTYVPLTRTRPSISGESEQPNVSRPFIIASDSPDKNAYMVVYESMSHKIAMFVPPTADNTPSLFPSPTPWTPEAEKSNLRWRPSKFRIDGWTEDDDYGTAISNRRWNPMGTAYTAPSLQPPTDILSQPPKNPGGCTGVNGRGHLPSWGPNAAIIMVITREVRVRDNGKLWHTKFWYAAYRSQLGAQLPWFLVQHPRSCDGKRCAKKLIDTLFNSRILEERTTNRNAIAACREAEQYYKSARFNKVYSGFIDDSINTNNAWIEPTGINVHFEAEPEEDSILLKMFAPKDVTLEWIEEDSSISVRSSHSQILKTALSKLTEESSKLHLEEK